MILQVSYMEIPTSTNLTNRVSIINGNPPLLQNTLYHPHFNMFTQVRKIETSILMRPLSFPPLAAPLVLAMMYNLP